MRRARVLAAVVAGWVAALPPAPLPAPRAQDRTIAPAAVAGLVAGDALPVALTATPGDPGRGRAIVASRSVGLCLLCHSGPFPEERFQGTLAPSLAGAGARWSEAQLRLRVVDGARLNPDTIMPSYYRVSGLQRVAKAFEDRTILTAQQIEDVVAWLATLKEP